MKVRILIDKYGYKKDSEVEIEDTEAKDLIEKKFAEEVKVDPTEVAVKEIETKLNSIAEGLVESISEKAATKTLEKVSKGLKRKGPQITVGPENITQDPKGGFKTFGQFCSAVYAKDVRGVRDNEYMKAGIAEGTDGAAVPTEYADQFFAIIMGEDSYVSYARNLPTRTETIKLASDALVTIGTNPIGGGWANSLSGNSGSPAYDGGQGVEKGTGFSNQITFTLNKYLVLVSATDEMLSDNNIAVASIINYKSIYDTVFGVNQAILQGSGTGQPLGIVNAPATVTVAAQVSDEYVSGVGIGYHDVLNMVGHFRRGMNPRPMWFVGYDSMSQIWGLKDDSGRALFTPSAGGVIANAPYGTLFGLPIVISDHCSQLGNIGDIILADMNSYVCATKNDGIQAATSVHLYFDKDKTAFRFTYRIDGRPGILSPLSLKANNSFKVSPFVVLSQRA